MPDLPAFLTVPAVLIWIATRDFGACQEAFEAFETLQREPFAAEDDKVTVWVPVQNFGLTAVSCIIAKYLHPDDRTIRDKWWMFDVLDGGCVRQKGKKRDTAAIDYEYAQAERELLRALSAGNITAYTVDPDNTMHEINAALWPEREFQDEKGKDGHYHVVAVAAGHEPLRSIRFKKEDILQRSPSEGGQKRGPKPGGGSNKDKWRRMAVEMLDSGEVQPKHGAKIVIANRVWERGYRSYQPNTIADAISKTVDEWKAKHSAA
jgi:hypothetical protein